MAEQFDFWGNCEEMSNPKPEIDKEKRNWENAFQKWSNKAGFKENIVEPYGVCGYSSICNYCEDNTKGRPCVRALNEMCREKKIKIDYSKRNYEDIWNGVF